MRFDGYHLLSDFVGIDNLQDRSFEVGTWKVRQLLFAPDDHARKQMLYAKFGSSSSTHG